MTWGTHFQRQLDWLITMAKVDGFKAQAWHRAKALDADPSGMWVGIKDALVAAIGQERASESESQSQARGRSVGPK